MTIAIVVVVLFGVGVAWLVTHAFQQNLPGCTVAPLAGDSGPFDLTPEQADNAATIAGVGSKLGMPDRSVTVALATAMQESKLQNLTSGDRDSAGLFQQRPSQGWGTYAQVTDPVYASTAFYQALEKQQDWQSLTITQAAQLVQHSAAPEAYAQWEPEARAVAVALTGEDPARLACHNLTIGAPTASLTATAANELGTAQVGGAYGQAKGWALASWLVAHAEKFGLNQVTFDGQTWTAASGKWTQSGPANGQLSYQVQPSQSS